jgi:hypothetical protein
MAEQSSRCLYNSMLNPTNACFVIIQERCLLSRIKSGRQTPQITTIEAELVTRGSDHHA